MIWAGAVMIWAGACSDTSFPPQIPKMHKKQSVTDGRTDRRTDRPTGTVTYRSRARDKKRTEARSDMCSNNDKAIYSKVIKITLMATLTNVHLSQNKSHQDRLRVVICRYA